MNCLCGDPATLGYEESECLFYALGYEWCPACDDHHRPPICVTVLRCPDVTGKTAQAHPPAPEEDRAQDQGRDRLVLPASRFLEG
jgi:hypothetical protein